MGEGQQAWKGVCMAEGMHGRGHACGGGHAWQGACMVGGVAQGACVVGGMHGGGHVWQEKWQLQWVVCILLECILIYILLELRVNCPWRSGQCRSMPPPYPSHILLRTLQPQCVPQKPSSLWCFCTRLCARPRTWGYSPATRSLSVGHQTVNTWPRHDAPTTSSRMLLQTSTAATEFPTMSSCCTENHRD